MPDYRQIDVFVMAKSAKAVLIKNQAHQEVWIPRTQIHGGDDAKLDKMKKGEEFTGLRVTQWILERKAEDTGSDSWLQLARRIGGTRPDAADRMAADCYTLIVRETADSMVAQKVKQAVREALRDWTGEAIDPEDDIPF